MTLDFGDSMCGPISFADGALKTAESATESICNLMRYDEIKIRGKRMKFGEFHYCYNEASMNTEFWAQTFFAGSKKYAGDFRITLYNPSRWKEDRIGTYTWVPEESELEISTNEAIMTFIDGIEVV